MKKYQITFVDDYCEYEEWGKKDHYWKDKIDENPRQLAMCKKWKGKRLDLSDLPDFIKEVGEVILSENEVEVYNGYRE